jgi:hypothetical protein
MARLDTPVQRRPGGPVGLGGRGGAGPAGGFGRRDPAMQTGAQRRAAVRARAAQLRTQAAAAGRMGSTCGTSRVRGGSAGRCWPCGRGRGRAGRIGCAARGRLRQRTGGGRRPSPSLAHDSCRLLPSPLLPPAGPRRAGPPVASLRQGGGRQRRRGAMVCYGSVGPNHSKPWLRSNRCRPQTMAWSVARRRRHGVLGGRGAGRGAVAAGAARTDGGRRRRTEDREGKPFARCG